MILPAGSRVVEVLSTAVGMSARSQGWLTVLDLGSRRTAALENGAMELPEVRFARADRVRIAYQEFGSGPRVLSIPALISNLDVMWEHEVYRRVLELARDHFHNVVFDKRGSGSRTNSISSRPWMSESPTSSR